MEFRSLGRTGVQVSPLCLGCMTFGRKTEEPDAMAIIDRAIEQGINFLDTANVYGRGASETVVGNALKRNGKRDRIVLATKVHGKMDDDDPNMYGNHRRHIVEQCEASLNRLQTDWIDLYQVHRPREDTPIDETLRALDDLVCSGKVRYIGTSTFAAWQVVASLWVSKEMHLNRFVTEQPPYHLMDRRVERELAPVAQTYGLGIIPWSPLCGGFLTGKYKRDGTRPENARFGADNDWNNKHFTDAAFDALEALEALARKKNCSLSQLSLAWCMHQPGITAPIIGPRTMEQFEDNIKALDVEITDADREKIDEICPPGRAIVPYYNAQFGPPMYRWQ